MLDQCLQKFLFKQNKIYLPSDILFNIGVPFRGFRGKMEIINMKINNTSKCPIYSFPQNSQINAEFSSLIITIKISENLRDLRENLFRVGSQINNSTNQQKYNSYSSNSSNNGKMEHFKKK